MIAAPVQCDVDEKRRRWHLHFTPTSSSWLNLVECWFFVLSRKA